MRAAVKTESRLWGGDGLPARCSVRRRTEGGRLGWFYEVAIADTQTMRANELVQEVVLRAGVLAGSVAYMCGIIELLVVCQESNCRRRDGLRDGGFAQTGNTRAPRTCSKVRRPS